MFSEVSFGGGGGGGGGGGADVGVGIRKSCFMGTAYKSDELVNNLQLLQGVAT